MSDAGGPTTPIDADLISRLGKGKLLGRGDHIALTTQILSIFVFVATAVDERLDVVDDHRDGSASDSLAMLAQSIGPR